MTRRLEQVDQPGFAVSEVEQHQIEPDHFQRVLQMLRQRGLDGLFDVSDGEGDGVGATQPQPLRHAVRQIAQLGHRLHHLAAGGLGDIGRAAQNSGYRGNQHPRTAGHINYCRQLLVLLGCQSTSVAEADSQDSVFKPGGPEGTPRPDRPLRIAASQ